MSSASDSRSNERNLTLHIGGRKFAVSCNAGEEDHITSLSHMIDGKARAAGAVGLSEPRMLLFAALMLADELDGLRKEGAGTGKGAVRADPAAKARLAARIDAMTQRIENIARHLEGGEQPA